MVLFSTCILIESMSQKVIQLCNCLIPFSKFWVFRRALVVKPVNSVVRCTCVMWYVVRVSCGTLYVCHESCRNTSLLQLCSLPYIKCSHRVTGMHMIQLKFQYYLLAAFLEIEILKCRVNTISQSLATYVAVKLADSVHYLLGTRLYSIHLFCTCSCHKI